MRRDLDETLMAEALAEARKAFEAGEVPVGAVVVDGEGTLLARAHNLSVTARDPTAHAEILALRKAAEKTGNYRLPGTTFYVTVEPCCMCAGALVWARVERLVYGTADPKAGAAGSLYRIPEDDRLNHRLEVSGGVREDECRELMRRFFAVRRPSRPSP